jgi:adenylate cyclase
MAPQETDSSELVRSQLEKVLSSAGFVRNDRLSGFLRFVVEQELSGRGDELKESVIGVEFFGRRPDYDVRQDSVVRTEAGKLRARLAEYYIAVGASDRLLIEIPKGGYRPVFRRIEHATTPVPRRPVWIWVAAALAVCAIAAAALWWQGLQHRNAPIPIAVLPLINLDQNPAKDYFADGLTGEIIRNLSIIEGLAVRSQTSSFALKGKVQDVRELGRQLAVDYILEGSVFRSGEHLRIDAQLIRVRDDFPLWSGRYDRELTDVFAIQDEISRGIVNSLRVKLGRGRRRYETSTEAYDLYLRARAKETRPQTTGMTESIEPFEQAIAKDPAFAPAYAGLAAAHAAISGFDNVNRQDDLIRMRDAARKAVQLDPLLAEAHEALGAVQARDAEWAESEKSFRRSIELDPSDSRAHSDFSMLLLLPLGRVEEAVTQARIAAKMDPLSPDVQAAAADVLRWAGLYRESATHCRPQSQCMGWALMGEGRIDEAIQILEPICKGREKIPGSQALGAAYALAHRREDAEAVVAIVPRPLAQAMVFAAMGDKERTIAALERAAPLGPIRIGRALVPPSMNFVRDDPRIRALRQNVGLP